MSCASCNRAPMGCPGRTCGDVGYNGGSCSTPSIGGRHMGAGGIGGVVSSYDVLPGRRCACPTPCCYPAPCTLPASECPTMACCPQRCAPPCCESARMNFCCPDPCRAPMKPCNPPQPCCRPFPCFPKVCCPCRTRPDPCMKRRCVIPSPVCPAPACGKLCLIPKHCPKYGCCAPIPICPPCPPATDGCKSCMKPIPVNPPARKRPAFSGCQSPCCPRPPFGLLPCEGDFPDPYCCPKPRKVVLYCPFQSYPEKKYCPP